MNEVVLREVLLPGSVKESFNDWGVRGCHKFVPVFLGDGTTIVHPGDLFDRPLVT